MSSLRPFISSSLHPSVPVLWCAASCCEPNLCSALTSDELHTPPNVSTTYCISQYTYNTYNFRLYAIDSYPLDEIELADHNQIPTDYNATGAQPWSWDPQSGPRHCGPLKNEGRSLPECVHHNAHLTAPCCTLHHLTAPSSILQHLQHHRTAP